MERSKGKLRADVAHCKLVKVGYSGSERTTRRRSSLPSRPTRSATAGSTALDPRARDVVSVGLEHRTGGRRTADVAVLCLPGVVEVPGGDPTRDRTLPTVLACFDQAMRRADLRLTDNEKTVTVDRVAGIPIRHPGIVAAGIHYGIDISNCQPDPESKGAPRRRSRSPKPTWCRRTSTSWMSTKASPSLKPPVSSFASGSTAREHRITRIVPAEMLAEERARLHILPSEPCTAALAETGWWTSSRSCTLDRLASRCPTS